MKSFLENTIANDKDLDSCRVVQKKRLMNRAEPLIEKFHEITNLLNEAMNAPFEVLLLSG
jgi:hypothetical protein